MELLRKDSIVKVMGSLGISRIEVLLLNIVE